MGERSRFLWALLFASAPFLFFWSTGLFDFDEGIYAAVVGEMARSGNWLIPVYNGEPWFEKPILLYWLTGPSISLFGPTIGPRLPSALCSISTIALCGWFVGRRTAGVRSRLTMWILGGSLLFSTVGNLMLTDSLMLLGLTGAVLFWIESVVGDARWRYASALSLGWGLLAKGPVVVILMAAIVAWTVGADAEFRKRTLQGWPSYLGIVAAVGCIWYVPAYFARPGAFVEQFILIQNVSRLMGGDEAHRVPWHLYVTYYIIVLGIAFAPWVYLLKRAWPRSTERAQDEHRFERAVAARWAVVVFALFTIGGSKLPHYILPVVPPCAVLLGFGLGSANEFLRMKYERLALAMVLFGTAVNLYLFPKYYEVSGQRQAHRMAEYAKTAGAPLATYLIRSPIRDPSIKTRLQETTLPSLSFYQRSAVPDYYTVAQLLRLDKATFVLTRDGKLEGNAIEELEGRFEVRRLDDLSDEDRNQFRVSRFDLYRLTPR